MDEAEAEPALNLALTLPTRRDRGRIPIEA
jgi:hypothetical protein